jgi:hypothetical protein
VALYRDEVARVTLPQVRAQFPPRTFKALSRVKLNHGTQSCVVAVETSPVSSCFGGARRWFRCPRCGARAVVIGFACDGPGCRACVRWRNRNRPRNKDRTTGATMAPRVKNVVASEVQLRNPE